MTPAILVFLLLFQNTQSRLPVTIRCELDTELVLADIKVSVEEKREVSAIPQTDSSVILRDLPDGNVNLVFFYRKIRVGEIEIKNTRQGEYIRVKARLVEDNVIFLEEFRIKGVDEYSTPETENGNPSSPSSSRRPSSTSSKSPSTCPEPDDPVALKGNIVRIIDNDSFEFESSTRSYIIYVGTATRLHRGGTSLHYGDLKKSLRLSIKGTVAAGPVGECSIGAKDITVHR